MLHTVARIAKLELLSFRSIEEEVIVGLHQGVNKHALNDHDSRMLVALPITIKK